jgi:hypothetical protein
MNRHERRRAAKMRQNTFYENHVAHLPEVPLGSPYERGRLYHSVYFHDDWCAIYDSGNSFDCNFKPTIVASSSRGGINPAPWDAQTTPHTSPSLLMKTGSQAAKAVKAVKAVIQHCADCFNFLLLYCYLDTKIRF